MSAWQPIETAPRDGTRVLLWFPGDSPNVQEAFWSDEKIGNTLPEDAGWYDWEGAGNSLTEHGRFPTHWKPMLEPPS